ncbi:pyridoxamine 5'-phosphate oxidase family protein [Candidatus Micrarchaeota archaeon]|nr:pyridoxamine 5'-phosphate oxidase family protein [Candidatus Micrarchaeota archaeon]
MAGKLKFVSSKPEETEKVAESARAILKDNNLLALSTFEPKEKQPCSCIVYYAFDDEFVLYVWTGPKTLHGKNIEENSRVALTVFDAKQSFDALKRGLQAFGSAAIVGDDELEKAGSTYLKRFPGAQKFVNDPKGFHSPMFNDRLYRIELSKIKLLDEEAFGKEELRELEIIR